VFSKTSKVMVDVEGGNNMMYLPLDKLVQAQRRRAAAPLDINTSNIRELTDAVTEQLRRDAAAQQSRRGGR
jgi:membrane protease subunit HflK